MPVENETKFLLHPEAFWIGGLLEVPEKRIEQCYIAEGTRVRSIVHPDGDRECLFTFKRRTSRGTIEIETVISEDDHASLAETAISMISKRRRSFDVADLHLDMDLFSTPEGDFVLLEVEMPEGMEATGEVLPSWLRRHLVAHVGDDLVYSNEAMASPEKRASIALLVTGARNQGAGGYPVPSATTRS